MRSSSPSSRRRYFHGGRVETSGEAGTPMRMLGPNGETWGDEVIQESEPPAPARRRLAFALQPRDGRPSRASRITWEIEPRDGGVCLVTLDPRPARALPAHRAATSPVRAGWACISGLKTAARDRAADAGVARVRRALRAQPPTRTVSREAPRALGGCPQAGGQLGRQLRRPRAARSSCPSSCPGGSCAPRCRGRARPARGSSEHRGRVAAQARSATSAARRGRGRSRPAPSRVSESHQPTAVSVSCVPV